MLLVICAHVELVASCSFGAFVVYGYAAVLGGNSLTLVVNIESDVLVCMAMSVLTCAVRVCADRKGFGACPEGR